MVVRAMLRRLKDNTRGLALIEFALALPLVLTIILYGLEIANYGLAMLRVHQIAATTADNAARVRDSINEADVNEVLLGGKIVGDQMGFAQRGRIVISDVVPNGLTNSAKGQRILWQRCTGALNTQDSQPRYGTEGKGRTDGSLQAMGMPGRQIAATDGSAMIFVEVTYAYQPIVSDALLGAQTLRSEASFSVREREAETLNASPGATPSLCTTYAA